MKEMKGGLKKMKCEYCKKQLSEEEIEKGKELQNFADEELPMFKNLMGEEKFNKIMEEMTVSTKPCCSECWKKNEELGMKKIEESDVVLETNKDFVVLDVEKRRTLD